MKDQAESSWSEEAYVAYLNAERALYAWCLEKHGNYSAADATKESLSFYKYEPESAPYRGLVLHDEAWHWAMLKIFGDLYWKKYPELESVSEEYKKEADKLHNKAMETTTFRRAKS